MRCFVVATVQNAFRKVNHGTVFEMINRDSYIHKYQFPCGWYCKSKIQINKSQNICQDCSSKFSVLFRAIIKY